jgi:hypothetical protein
VRFLAGLWAVFGQRIFPVTLNDQSEMSMFSFTGFLCGLLVVFFSC